MKYINNNPQNYLVKLYDEYGEDFLNSPKISCIDIQNNALKILKDIFRNNLDLSVFGKYILNPTVLENIKHVVLCKLQYYNYLSECTEFTRINKYANDISNVATLVEVEVKNKYKTFNMIYITLCSIEQTQNITELNVLSQRLFAENLIYNL